MKGKHGKTKIQIRRIYDSIYQRGPITRDNVSYTKVVIILTEYFGFHNTLFETKGKLLIKKYHWYKCYNCNLPKGISNFIVWLYIVHTLCSQSVLKIDIYIFATYCLQQSRTGVIRYHKLSKNLFTRTTFNSVADANKPLHLTGIIRQAWGILKHLWCIHWSVQRTK